MHLMSKAVGVKLLAAAAAVGLFGWVTIDGEVSAQTKSTTNHHSHPHLRRALHELRQAHHNLKEAHGHFGGHRTEALHDVDRAIRQVEEALHHTNHGNGNGKSTTPSTGAGTTTPSTRKSSLNPSGTRTGLGTGITRPTRTAKNGVVTVPQK